MNTTLPLRRIRDFGEKVTDTFAFIKLNWKNLMVLYGLFVLPFLLAGVYLGAGYFSQLFTTITSNRTEEMFANWKFWGAMLVVYMATNAMATSVYVYMKVWEEENRRATPGEILKLMPLPFLTNLLYTLMTAVLFTVVLLPVILLAIGAKGAGSAVLIGLYVFFAMIGLLLSLPYLLMIYPANSIGGWEMGNAFRASWILLKGNWWPSLGYVIVLSIIYYVFSFLVQFVLTIIFGAGALIGSGNMAEDLGKGMTVVYGLSMLIQQIFYIIIFVGAGILYYSLHEQKIGGGLEKMIDEMGGSRSRFNQEEEY